MAIGRFRDAYDNPISTSSADAADRYVAGVDRMLSANAGAEDCFAEAIAIDEGFALAHADRALALLVFAQNDAAKASAARALEVSAGTTRRERQHVEIVHQIANGQGMAAIDRADEHLIEFPRDAVMLRQMATLLLFNGGVRKKDEALRVMTRIEPHYPDDPLFLAASALILQDAYQFEEARRRAERALALYPRHAFGAHSLAHVYFETGDVGGGSGFLGAWFAGYDEAAPLYCHLAWHWALFELAAGHHDRVVRLYENEIGPAFARHANRYFDAASLLWRREIWGESRETLPWDSVREAAARATVRPGFVFNDLHAAMAFAAAGDEAALDRIIGGLSQIAAGGNVYVGAVVLPVIHGLAAFAAGDFAEAVRRLGPVIDLTVGLGGSNAQREVIEDTLIEACLQTENFDQAETLLRRRLRRRPSPRDFLGVARAQTGRGEVEAARANLAAARSGWADADPDAPELAALARLEAQARVAAG